jgi:hypothetical protein
MRLCECVVHLLHVLRSLFLHLCLFQSICAFSIELLDPHFLSRLLDKSYLNRLCGQLLMHDQIFQGLCKIDSIASGELTSALRNCASALAFMLFSHSLIFVSSRAYLPPHRKFEEL